MHATPEADAAAKENIYGQTPRSRLDRLDPGQFAAIGQLLAVMADPVTRALLNAPPDDEPVTEKDRRRFQDGQTWFAQHEGTPMEDVLNEFGLKPEDFPLSKEHAG